MIGVGYRREMRDWDMSAVNADFFEVVPENWLRRDRAPLHDLCASGRPVFLHSVSLNLGGQSVINEAFLRDIRALLDELGSPHYSDHLASSGDAHQLYDLFPIPLTMAEVVRVSDRIRRAQDILGRRMAVENATWYTNCGNMTETEFISRVAERADCQILLDLNNIVVNHKNHGLSTLKEFVTELDMSRVSYLHVAGHEFNDQLGMYIDTHSQPVETLTAQMAHELSAKHGLNVLLEWDNDVPELDVINQELACLQPSMTT